MRLELDFVKAETNLVLLENCEKGDTEGTIINLHPDFAIHEKKLHEDYASPFLEYASLALRSGAIPVATPPHDYDATKRIFFLLEEWSYLKTAWSLMLNSQCDLSNKTTKINSIKFEYGHEIADTNEWIYSFSLRVLAPSKVPLFTDAATYIQENIIQQYPEETNRLKNFYIDNFHANQMESTLEIYSEFFGSYSEYSQVIFALKQNIAIPNSHKASSTGFNQTRMFFGNAYESITSCFTLLACLNNIAKGRKYDLFSTMNLEKYMTINKANRANPFKDIGPFYRLADCLNSSLRNASHHGAMRFNKKKNKIVYRSGGTGSENTLTYTEYLIRCSNLMFSLSALTMLQLSLLYAWPCTSML